MLTRDLVAVVNNLVQYKSIGVRQGYKLSPFLFLLIIDFVMCHGIHWTSQSRLNDLDFADDVSLFAETILCKT